MSPKYENARMRGEPPVHTVRTAALAAIAAATVVVTAVVGTGTVSAAPVATAPATGTVHAQVSRPTPDSVRLAVTGGTLAVVDGAVSVRTSAGRELERFALTYIDGDRSRRYPIDAALAADGRSVRLVPSRDGARSVPVAAAEVDRARVAAAKTQKDKAQKQQPGQSLPRRYNGPPRTRQERDRRALQDFTQTAAVGMSVGQIIGMVIGAIIGGAIGCLVVGIPSGGIGCILGGLLGGMIVGAILGMVIAGGPALIIAAIIYFNTINSPFRPPGAAPAKPNPRAAAPPARR